MIEKRRRLESRFFPILLISTLLAGLLGTACERSPQEEGWTRLLLEADLDGVDSLRQGSALERCVNVLQARLKNFGVREASVTRQGEDKIVVAFPRYMDTRRAGQLLGSTARLEFQLVAGEFELVAVLQNIGTARMNMPPESDSSGQTDPSGAADSTPVALEGEGETGVLTWLEEPGSHGTGSTSGDFSSLLGTVQNGRVLVLDDHVPAVKQVLGEASLNLALPRDHEFLWGHGGVPDEAGRSTRPFYYCLSKAEIGGEHIVETEIRPDDHFPGHYAVDFSLDREGSDLFDRVTRLNVNRQLAIVLDDEVVSAPVIMSRIPNGQGSITGGFSAEEAHDLAVILRSGALPVPLRVLDVISRKNDSAH